MKQIHKIIVLNIIILISLFFKVTRNNGRNTLDDNIKELFDNKKTDPKTIVLMGDSIFRNEIYVPPGDCVYSVLSKRLENKRVNMVAEDGATISTMTPQLDNLLLSTEGGKSGIEFDEQNNIVKSDNIYNNKNTNIYISFGGNDIIHNFITNISNHSIDEMFHQYVTNLYIIKNVFPKANIYLSTVYFPTASPYNQYRQQIEDWNKKIITYAKENNMKILPIHEYLKHPEDFTHDIEPSIDGTKKLVTCIENNL
jgi:hypothetical protein